MNNHSSITPFEAKDRKPASPPVTTFATASNFPNPDAASSSFPWPPPHPVFMDSQREIIMEMHQDNEENKFRQKMIEKLLEWLLDSGAKDLAQ